MTLKQGDWWDKRYKQIEAGYQQEDLQRANENVRHLGSNAGSASQDANRTEEELLQELQLDREFLQTRISECADLRSDLKREWLERLQSIGLKRSDVQARLIELANEVTEVGDREHVRHLRAFQLSTAASLRHDLAAICRKLENLASKSHEYHNRRSAETRASDTAPALELCSGGFPQIDLFNAG